MFVKLVRIVPFVLVFASTTAGCKDSSSLSDPWPSWSDSAVEQAIAVGREAEEKGEFDAALRAYEDALSRMGGEKGVERARILQAIGKVQNRLGDYLTASHHLEEALRLAHGLRPPDPRLQMRIALYLGNAYKNLGAFQKAVEAYEETYRLSRIHGDISMEGASHIGFGNVYLNLGQPDTALDHYRRARILLQDRQRTAGRTYAVVLHNLGWAYLELGELGRAEALLEEALGLRTRQGNLRGVASTKANLGILDYERGEFGEAAQRLEEAFKLARKAQDVQTEALAALYLGLSLMKTEEPEKALPWIEGAVERCRTHGFRDDLWPALFAYAEVMEALGRPAEEVEAAYREAMAIVGDLGAQLAARGARDAFFADKEHLYAKYIAFLRRRGREMESARFAEEARRLRFHPTDAGFPFPPEAYVLDVAKIEEEAKRFLGHLEAASPTGEERARLALRRLGLLYHRKLQRSPSPSEDRLLPPLAREEALLSYYETPEGIIGWWIDADGVESFEVPLSSDLLRGKITRFREDLVGGERAQGVGQELADLLLGPVSPHLSQVDRLVIVAPDFLHALPWAALPGPAGAFLGETHRVAMALHTAPLANASDDSPHNLSAAHAIAPPLLFTLGAEPLFGGEGRLAEAFVGSWEDLLEQDRGRWAGNILHIGLPLHLTEEPLFTYMKLRSEGGGTHLLMISEWLRRADHRPLIVLSGGFVADSAPHASGLPDALQFIEFLLSQGVPAVIALQWPVSKEVLREFIALSIEKASSGISAAEAFHQAQTELIQKGIPAAQWAAFTSYGTPR
ncbi:MAG: CHAT domain-containing protein [Deltaproteobacteria bacterium]|nr:MAG: CHAT domain-containing protein [Deltaproteobacteria bacterium]